MAPKSTASASGSSPTPPPASAPAPAPATLGLPDIVAGPADIGRLLRELESINEAMLQLGLREAGSNTKLPRTSRLMDLTIELNSINLLNPEDRQRLMQFLQAVKDRAPVLHMSFGADPPIEFIAKIVAWTRKELSPYALVTIGLQPSIGAGCVIRTTNKLFDFSLRQDFANKRDLLAQQLKLQGAVK